MELDVALRPEEGLAVVAMSGPASGLFEGVWAEAGCGQDHASLLDAAAGPGQATYAAYDAAVTARACELLRDRSRQRESCEPYCLVVGLLLPHNPYVCPKELLDEYMDTLPAPESAEHVPAAEHPAVRRLRRFRGADRITPEQARLARAAYFGLITLMDQNIGRILDTLVARGQADNTIVMYTSDHGEMAGDHGLWWKDSFYEGSVGVPMIWSWPRHFGAGRRVDAVVSLLDVGPTLTDLAGAAPLPGARGHSLMPLLAPGGRAEEWPDTAFAETCAVGQRPARMIRAGRWKLNVYDGYEQPQLFDMNADPEEMNDLGADPACAAVRRELMARVMDGWSPARVEALVKDALDAWPPREPERFTPGVSECWRMPAGSNFRV